MRHTTLFLTLLLSANLAEAEQLPKLIAVLPLDVTHAAGKLNADAEASLEEMLRDEATNTLTIRGWTVLATQNMLQTLRDNGINPETCGDGECPLSAARNLKAAKFISGAVEWVEGKLLVSVRLIDTASGRILSTCRLEGETVMSLQDQLRAKSDTLFHPMTSTPLPTNDGPSVLVTPPPANNESSIPVVTKGKVTTAVGSLLVFVKPADKVRLVLTDPDGKRIESGVPYENPTAKPGVWKVAANADGYFGDARVIEVPPDEPTELKFDIKHLGSLSIAATPADKVHLEIIDPQGTRITSGSPYKNGAAVSGRWEVLAKAGGYESDSKFVDIELETPVAINFGLKTLGSLEITGIPEGSAVSVTGPDGFKDQGGSPWKAKGLKSGMYQVSVSRDGYKTDRSHAIIKAGETSVVTVKLVKELVKERPNLTPQQESLVDFKPLCDTRSEPGLGGGLHERKPCIIDPAFKDITVAEMMTRKGVGHGFGIASVALGAVGLVIGTAMGIDAISQTNINKSTPSGQSVQSTLNTINTISTSAVVGLSVGGVLTATGTGLLIAF